MDKSERKKTTKKRRTHFIRTTGSSDEKSWVWALRKWVIRCDCVAAATGYVHSLKIVYGKWCCVRWVTHHIWWRWTLEKINCRHRHLCHTLFHFTISSAMNKNWRIYLSIVINCVYFIYTYNITQKCILCWPFVALDSLSIRGCTLYVLYMTSLSPFLLFLARWHE